MTVFPDGTELLLTCAEMARADGIAIAGGISGISLMASAGAAVAVAIRRRYRPRPALVLAGPGNNGGDGWVVARNLADHGWDVRVAALGDSDGLRGDAAWARTQWMGPVETVGVGALDGAALVVDALFGAGLTRDLDGPAGETVSALAGLVAAGRVVSVAVDVPSGVDGDTGLVRGVAAPADLTVTFFRRKPGHLLLPGRSLCGTLRVCDIGIPAAALESIDPRTAVDAPPAWRGSLAGRTPSDHKYRRGHVVVVGGAMAGAARLALAAARRSGVGLATAAVPPGSSALYANGAPGAIVRDVAGAEALAALLADPRFSAVVVGPGLGDGEKPRALVSAVLSTGRAVLIDADGIGAFAGAASDLASRITGPVVLTPHEGEFRRLLPDLDLAAGKLVAARAAAARLGAVVLLKGADTVVAAPDGRAVLVDNAPPTLATAGSGDVLAGLIGGLLARGVPAFEAASAGAWIHGEAGLAAGPSVIAEDLVERIGPLVERP